MFRYQADKLPITLFVSYFLFDLFVYFSIDSLAFLIPYTLISIIVKAYICAWNHHHQHVETFSSPVWNRLLEIIYWFQTGIVGYGWVLHHNLGHHMHYLDQAKDESAWKSPEGKRYSALMYTWVVSITAYIRAWGVGARFPKIQKYFLAMMLIQASLLVLLLAYRPLQGFLFFLLPMITGLFLTVYTTYHHHSGLDTDDHLKASYNITERWYNILTGNLGYHTAHHMKGSLHWSLLPAYHAEIAAGIEEKYFKKYRLFWYEQKEDVQMNELRKELA